MQKLNKLRQAVQSKLSGFLKVNYLVLTFNFTYLMACIDFLTLFFDPLDVVFESVGFIFRKSR